MRKHPLKGQQMRRNYINWLSSDLKDQMSERDKIREQARQTQDPLIWSRYRIIEE